MDHLNIYETEFHAPCPVNGIRTTYYLRIETQDVLMAEHIIGAVEPMTGTHEEIADRLKLILGGAQTLSAYHHGVSIGTRR